MPKPGPKEGSGELTEKLQFRLTVRDANRIKMLAHLYAGGDVSKWIRHGAINAPRRKLK